MAAAAATAATKGNGGGGGARAGAGEASGARKKRGPGPLATAYLVIYNVVMTAGWLVIAVGLVRAYLAKGSYHSLYYSIEKPLKFFQTGALLEILHCAIGIVPSSVVLTSFQVMSRVFLIWAVTHSVKEVQSEDSVLLFVIAWTITEIIRYSFYTFSLLNHLPYLIKWASMLRLAVKSIFLSSSQISQHLEIPGPGILKLSTHCQPQIAKDFVFFNY
ncbi:very-long-chain (3R)-3-hydroxyacyl-CoA dehydratase 2 isoform X2 [Eptesicus fuscus]|uniref:very-long-chain (3R)-3-hydroxyacyl-CoA dehydratase 2 isoform X2 n=1 Tax=Eptesicus fuscus TaxID=29078 RepID=UPI002403EEBF|nr:very-long-chain (3R)-3-hydroxyacyl-CoA dehydratase 2 isoform X2 [Eptesicus fuscus]